MLMEDSPESYEKYKRASKAWAWKEFVDAMEKDFWLERIRFQKKSFIY